MDRAPAHSDQEVELDVSREDQALEGLESHAAQEEGAGPVGEHAAIPGVEGRDLAASAEHGAADATHASPEGAHGETPGNAVSAIDPKISAARTKMWTKQQNARLKAQKARIAGRNRGKDWTAQVLADTLKNQGAQGVIIALNTHKTAEGIAVLKTANQWDPLLAALPVGKLIGTALTNQEDRTHIHSFQTSADLPYKSISAANGGNGQGASAARYTDSGNTEPAPSGLPFVQLVGCVKQ